MIRLSAREAAAWAMRRGGRLTRDEMARYKRLMVAAPTLDLILASAEIQIRVEARQGAAP